MSDGASAIASLIGYVIGLAITAALAIIPMNMAKKKGYNPWVFFFFGVVAWLPAIIVASVMKDKNQELGYPQQYGGYPQQNSGYPQQRAYPQQNNIYPQQPAYPQQNSGYPQQPAYPQQNSGYPQQPAFPQQNSTPQMFDVPQQNSTPQFDYPHNAVNQNNNNTMDSI